MIVNRCDSSSFFLCNETATTEIYTLSLHDALLISSGAGGDPLLDLGSGEDFHDFEIDQVGPAGEPLVERLSRWAEDRKSTRLNSSHLGISYAVFCLKKKNNKMQTQQ